MFSGNKFINGIDCENALNLITIKLHYPNVCVVSTQNTALERHNHDDAGAAFGLVNTAVLRIWYKEREWMEDLLRKK